MVIGILAKHDQEAKWYTTHLGISKWMSIVGPMDFDCFAIRLKIDTFIRCPDFSANQNYEVINDQLKDLRAQRGATAITVIDVKHDMRL